MAETPEYITKFMQAVYPGYDALAMATGTTESALEDATECISDLRSRVQELVAANSNLRQRLMDEFGITDEDIAETMPPTRPAEYREPTPEEPTDG